MRGLLGADLFVTPLLVFIITTGLLFMNTNKNGGDVAQNHPSSLVAQEQKTPERELPKIELPRGASGGLPVGKEGVSVTLSARSQGRNILYFLDEEPVAFELLHARLLEKHASSVRIRFDKDLSYGLYIRAIETCKEAGVKQIINVYTRQ